MSYAVVKPDAHQVYTVPRLRAAPLVQRPDVSGQHLHVQESGHNKRTNCILQSLDA